MKNIGLVSIISPFYNEEEGVVLYFKKIFEELIKNSNYKFEIICVDDGSIDATSELLMKHCEIDNRICLVELSRNFGKEAALTAGLDVSQGDLIIILDSDLQDPISLISEFLRVWEEQKPDIVLAKRGDRTSDTKVKKISAQLFYKMINYVSDTLIPDDVGDTRLMTRQVANAIGSMNEKKRFMKGMMAWVGFKSVQIEYKRSVRQSGKTKFNLFKLWNFALDGITSFSTLPLRIWTYVGCLGVIIAVSKGLLVALDVVINGVDAPGYASTLIFILFFGSAQLMALGIIGEYLGRTYLETKGRPIYLIRSVHKNGSSADLKIAE